MLPHFTEQLDTSAVLQTRILELLLCYSGNAIAHLNIQLQKKIQEMMKTIHSFYSNKDMEIIIPLLTMLVHKWSGKLELVLRLI